MAPKQWLLATALCIMLGVVCVVLVLSPPGTWHLSSIVALLLLAFAAGQTFLLPYMLQGRSEITRLAMVGPTVVYDLLFLGWALLAFVLNCAIDSQRVGWALDLITLFSFAALHFLRRAAESQLDVLEDQATPYGKRDQWQANLRIIQDTVKDTAVQQQISKLIEKIRFAPRDIAGMELPENVQIDNLIADLFAEDAPHSANKLKNQMAEIEKLLILRQSALMSARNQAN